MVMDQIVLISMNVLMVLIVVIEMLDVEIPKVLIVALVMPATMVMVELVVMSTNVPLDVTNVIVMLAASIRLAVTIVNAMLVFEEMAKDVLMLMSAHKIHAIIIRYALILLALTNARNVPLATMSRHHGVLILMNAHVVLINVIVMLDVTIEKAVMIANVMLVTMVMVEPAVMLMNVQPINTTAKVDMDALIPSVVLHVTTLTNVQPISINVMRTPFVVILLEVMTVLVLLALKVSSSLD